MSQDSSLPTKYFSSTPPLHPLYTPSTPPLPLPSFPLSCTFLPIPTTCSWLYTYLHTPSHPARGWPWYCRHQLWLAGWLPSPTSPAAGRLCDRRHASPDRSIPPRLPRRLISTTRTHNSPKLFIIIVVIWWCYEWWTGYRPSWSVFYWSGCHRSVSRWVASFVALRIRDVGRHRFGCCDGWWRNTVTDSRSGTNTITRSFNRYSRTTIIVTISQPRHYHHYHLHHPSPCHESHPFCSSRPRPCPQPHPSRLLALLCRTMAAAVATQPHDHVGYSLTPSSQQQQ